MSDIKYKYLSFSQLFSETYSGVRQVVIPKIQRDYAQGRSIPQASRTRKNFLNTIYQHIIKNKDLTLDFIYGNVINKENPRLPDYLQLTPLDGQQRLTTLFLLYWYAAKKENLDSNKYAFLNNFTYETRPSSKAFCKQLISFNPSFNETLKDEIKNQYWFPASWEDDPTIASMLTMLDAIQAKFECVENLWKQLEYIKFYYLPLEVIDLTDEVYIKMNSRGKQLTRFENFKSELEKLIEIACADEEGNLSEEDRNKKEEIALNVDTKWTNLLWTYAIKKYPDNPVIDDFFLNYFHYICDVICFLDGNELPIPTKEEADEEIEFYLLNKFFKGDTAKRNIDILCDFFNCWCDSPLTKEDDTINLDKFFATFLYDDTPQITNGKYDCRVRKYTLRQHPNLFKACIESYGQREFTLANTIMLYAVIVYLQNPDITLNDFIERYRILYNLLEYSQNVTSVKESSDSGNRMPAMLKHAEHIIKTGTIIDSNIDVNGKLKPHFNTLQIKEEIAKIEFRKNNPDLIDVLYEIEDHFLLNGQIAILATSYPVDDKDEISYTWNKTERFKKLAKLFECEWDNVDCALLALGDYTQRERNQWRTQMGSTFYTGAPWMNLFHRNRYISGWENTNKYLCNLLDSFETIEEISDEKLSEIATKYHQDCTNLQCFDWRYYYIKYPTFRIGRYGKYRRKIDTPYEITAIWAPEAISTNSKDPFLSEMCESSHYESGQLTKVGEYTLENQNECVKIWIQTEDNQWVCLIKFAIPQNNEGIDIKDRIQLVKPLLTEWLHQHPTLKLDSKEDVDV